MASTPVRRTAIELARDSGSHVVSQAFRLLLEENVGYLMFVAGYKSITVPPSEDARRAQFFGVTLGVFSIGQ